MAAAVMAAGSQQANELQDLLGKAGSGLPLWLTPEKFLQDEFDPESCVTDLRRYVRMAVHPGSVHDLAGLGSPGLLLPHRCPWLRFRQSYRTTSPY